MQASNKLRGRILIVSLYVHRTRSINENCKTCKQATNLEARHSQLVYTSLRSSRLGGWCPNHTTNIRSSATLKHSRLRVTVYGTRPSTPLRATHSRVRLP